MRQFSGRGAAFWGVAAVWLAVAAWACRHPSGWIIKAQSKGAVGMRLSGWVDDQSISGRQNARNVDAQIAAQYPNDFQTQLAAMLRNVSAKNAPISSEEPKVPLDAWNGQQGREGHDAALRLRGLLPRFGREPALHATILRSMARADVGLWRRKDGDVLTNNETDKTQPLFPASAAAYANTPESLRNWNAACASGEALDPNNAYFPAMRAVGLFAQNRDKEAEAALLRASRAACYNDYSSDEPGAIWHLMEQTGGEPGAIPRFAEYASVCFWQYAPLRQMARLATVSAMNAEVAGDTERGFKLRQSVGRLGVAMQTSGKGSLIMALVGGNIARTSFLRPGGSPLVLAGKNQSERTANVYREYLIRTGHAGETEFVDWECRAGKQVRVVAKASYTLPQNDNRFTAFGRLSAAWAVGVILLSNIFVVLLAGGLAWVYLRIVPLLTGPVRLALHVLGGVGVCGGLFALGCYGGAVRAAGLGLGLTAVLENVPNADLVTLNAVAFVSAAGVFVPLLLCHIKASRRARVPVALGVAHGLVRTALPITGVLLFCYGLVFAWTSSEEAKLSDYLRHVVQNEGPYLARQTGTTWPAPFANESKGGVGK